ncbi:hypothetical protein CXF46_10455 [Corynebacterium bovis]|nr:hypothetical protein CXF38_10010 [Corynebacterium bovis]RRO83355.1 hypothetical protein CXF36_03325 [Corynebacterium bovis]RRO84515.1 hypothetical protein CXF37_03080 [Corynebacterium bovis]RRO91671.1 hypothetical protein CXF45_03175 [Corynebacterium bovis]RRO95046.1 hypothetical protein CXF29_05835 [Corynebacterium bovis]
MPTSTFGLLLHRFGSPSVTKITSSYLYLALFSSTARRPSSQFVSPSILLSWRSRIRATIVS